MAKPFTIFKRSSGIYYCDFTNEATGELIRRSTGTRDYNEAQKVVLSWYKNNNVVPANASQKLKEKKEKTSMEKIALFQLIRSKDFTSDDAKDIIDALIEKDFIKSAVFTNSVEAVDAVEYLTTFWDYENSPYVREKKLKGQEIHKGYCSEKASKIRIYWVPRLEGKVLGSITVNDVKDFFKDPVVEKLAPKTVNEIIMSLTIPLKCCKNGYEREVMIAPVLRDMLLAQASLNPYASHIEHNSAMERLNNAASQIFLPALQSLEGIDFEVRDEDIK